MLHFQLGDLYYPDLSKSDDAHRGIHQRRHRAASTDGIGDDAATIGNFTS